jgi:hypothetical protein
VSSNHKQFTTKPKGRFISFKKAGFSLARRTPEKGEM